MVLWMVPAVARMVPLLWGRARMVPMQVQGRVHGGAGMGPGHLRQ